MKRLDKRGGDFSRQNSSRSVENSQANPQLNIESFSDLKKISVLDESGFQIVDKRIRVTESKERYPVHIIQPQHPGRKDVFDTLFGTKYTQNLGPTILMGEKEVVMMGAVNYLGLSHHPKVIEASINAIQMNGAGGLGSRYSNGYLESHALLDEKVKFFLNKKDVAFFNSGFMANLGIFSAFEKNATVFSDKENHLSLYDGVKMSGLKNYRFKHNDIQHLEKLLSICETSNKWVVLVGTFGATGENVKLEEIVKVAKKYGAKIYLDDAHAIGIYGKNKRGLSELQNVYDDIDLLMTSFQMAFGSTGAVVSGDPEIIEKIKYYSRPYMFSFTMPANTVAAVLTAIDIIQSDEGDKLIRKLLINATKLRAQIKGLGFEIISEDSQIVSIHIGKEEKICDFAQGLLMDGVWTQKYVQPAVPKQKANIRFTCMSSHTDSHIEYCMDMLEKNGKKCGLI